MNQARVTTDHKEIKKWAEKYGGKPQIIDDSQALADSVGIRIDFPGQTDDLFLPETKVRDVSWEEFFKKFDELNLAFIYKNEVDLKKPRSLYISYRFIKRDGFRQRPPGEVDKLLADLMKGKNIWQ